MKITTKSLFISLALLFLTASAGMSQVTASLTDNTAPFNSVTLNAGESFTLTLNLTTTTEQLLAVDYFLTITGPSSGFFSITGRNITNSLFTDTFATNGAFLNAASALLDPTNNTNGGATVTDTAFPTTGLGPFNVADLTISSSVSVPVGIYIFSITNGEVSFGDQFNPTTQQFSASYTINVIPEPTTFALLGLASFIAVGARRRRITLN